MAQTCTSDGSGMLSRPLTLGAILAWLGVLLAMLVLAAHYYRSGNYTMTICLAGIIALHFGTSAWKRYVLGAVLCLGAVEWCMSIHSLIILRVYLGQTWLRASIILGLVAALTALAGIYSLLAAKRQSSANPLAIVQALAFMLVFLILYQLNLYKPDLLLLKRFWPFWGNIELVLLAWYAALVTGGLLNLKTSRKTRRMAWGIFALIFFGQLALGLLGVPMMRTLESAHIPIPGLVIFAPIYRGELGFMPVFVLIITLLVGSSWCSMLCYFGPLEAAFCAKRPVREPSGFLALALRHGRISVLIGGILISTILKILGASNWIAMSAGLTYAGVSLLLLLIASRKYAGMVHCTAFCPLGLIVSVLARLSPWRVRIDPKRCDNCGSCEKACFYHAIDAGRRQKGSPHLRCTLCRDCIAVCPKEAISLGMSFVGPPMAAWIFVLLLVSLHVLFIATARPL